MIKSGIYKIQHKKSGRLYIGSSADTSLRLRKHKEALRRNCHVNAALQNSFNKYGESAFEFSIMLICDKKDLVFYEQSLMDEYKSYIKLFGFNIRKKAENNSGVASKRLLHKAGQRYGMLTLIKQTEIGSNKWLCQCDCGKEKIVNAHAMKCGFTTSCGCFRVEKLSKLKTAHKAGNKYGRWTLISLNERKKHGGNFWNVRCDCGNCGIKNIASIVSGISQSCGCLRSEIMREKISKINAKRELEKFSTKENTYLLGQLGLAA